MGSLRIIIAFVFICIGFFIFIMDADFVTYFYHIYRHQLVSNCFQDKTIWIVGASSGIGECLTYDLVKNGASKIILSSRRIKQLKRVQSNAHNLIQNGQEITVMPLDLLDFLNEDYAASFITELFAQHPSIDIVILNSGITQNASALETSWNAMKLLFDVNFFGTVSIVKSVINNGFNLEDKNKQFQIVITSSLSALLGEPYSSAYAATKSAFNGYINSVQVELIKYNIDFTLVYPGAIQLDSNSLDTVQFDGTAAGRDFIYGKFDQNEIMSCSRCAELYSTAIYSKVRHSWISKQPPLALTYLAQYCSFIMKFLQQVFGPNYL
eukprot:212422_1